MLAVYRGLIDLLPFIHCVLHMAVAGLGGSLVLRVYQRDPSLIHGIVNRDLWVGEMGHGGKRSRCHNSLAVDLFQLVYHNFSLQ